MAEDRGEAMALRLEKAARRAGLDEHAAHLADTFHAVLRVRAREIADPHDPAFLHPARTTLILLEDLRITDPDVLLAALLIDSERPALELPAAEARARAGPRAAAIAAAVPRAGEHGDRDRLESLVALDKDALVVALAERLDHARHLHLEPPSAWTRLHHDIGTHDLPAASRSHPRIAWRLQRWHESFGRRFLRTPR